MSKIELDIFYLYFSLTFADMNLVRKLRLLLLPLSFVYGGITWLRNKAFDLGWLKTYEIPVKSIVIGNLSVGGTGKTPHVSWLADQLKKEFSVAILSRGYGRKTTGFVQASNLSTVTEIGDEPLSYFHQHGKNVDVAVCEKRAIGIQTLLSKKNYDCILLDDAFQHRYVQAGIEILLSDFHSPFFSDFPLPGGNLREFRSGKNRADYLVFTKCPENLTENQKQAYIQKSTFHPSKVFFSHIQYGELKQVHGESVPLIENVLLITGIANPSPLQKEFEKNYNVELLRFPDHHAFSEKDIEAIHKKFDTFANRNKIIATTEKDWMRLISFKQKNQLKNWPLFVQYISVKLDRDKEWLEEIKKYVRTI